jgi:protein-disulfide isomerase
MLEKATNVAILVVAGVLVWTQFIRQPGKAGPRSDVPVPSTPISLQGAASAGSRSAPVAIIEYSDFQCPYCGVFVRDILPVLEREYIAPGRAVLAFRHVPLKMHQFAEKAAESAECAGSQDKFWPMHDWQFSNQTHLDDEGLRQGAAAVGLNLKAFSTCLSGEMKEKVDKDRSDAGRLGIISTPLFLIGRTQPDGTVKVLSVLSGARPVTEFRKALDAATAAR